MPFRDQVVNGRAFESEQSLNILEPSEFRHDIGAVSESNGLGGEAFVVHFIDVLVDSGDFAGWFHAGVCVMSVRKSVFPARDARSFPVAIACDGFTIGRTAMALGNTQIKSQNLRRARELLPQ
jgi:hypothetical protein